MAEKKQKTEAKKSEKKTRTGQTKKTSKKTEISLYWKILLVVGVVLFSFFLLSLIRPFSDWYVNHVTPALHGVIAPVFNVFPFAFGEIVMYFGAVLVVVTVLLSIVFGVKSLIGKVRRKPAGKSGFYRVYMKTVLAVAVLFLWTYMFHWWIPYSGNVLGDRRISRDNQYTINDFRRVKVILEERIDWAQKAVTRDLDGRIVYPSQEEGFQKVVESMKKLSDRYPRLKGYYGRPKAALCSDVLHWMSIGGYTYPYTMEITFNKYVNKFHWYALIAHEAAHYKGFYKENEGSFIGFLTCVTSDDPLVVYSGCTDVYFQVLSAYANALIAKYGMKDGMAIYKKTMQEDPGFDWDQYYLDEEDAGKQAQEAYAQDSHPLQEYADTAADVADIGWDVQGDFIAENDYSDVLRLIMEYYRLQKTEE